MKGGGGQGHPALAHFIAGILFRPSWSEALSIDTAQRQRPRSGNMIPAGHQLPGARTAAPRDRPAFRGAVSHEEYLGPPVFFAPLDGLRGDYRSLLVITAHATDSVVSTPACTGAVGVTIFFRDLRAT